MFASCGNYMCTFHGLQLRVCGFDGNAQWINGANNSRLPVSGGETPVSMVGFGDGGPSVVVLTSAGRLFRCGLPQGDWVQDLPPPPAPPNKLQGLMGAGFGRDNSSWFLTAVDVNNNGWIVGKPLEGGEWAPLSNRP